ncbi:Endoribonuclease L-PSP/chorismate mutase-like protein [Aspergillus germanicus]
MSHLQYFSYPGFDEHMRQVLSYNQAVRTGNRIDISGQGGWDPETRVVHSDLLTDFRQAFANVELALTHAGGKGWSQVYKLRIYVLDNSPEVFELLMRNLKEWMPDHQPLLTCVVVKDLGLEGMRIEVEACAHLAN